MKKKEKWKWKEKWKKNEDETFFCNFWAAKFVFVKLIDHFTEQCLSHEPITIKKVVVW